MNFGFDAFGTQPWAALAADAAAAGTILPFVMHGLYVSTGGGLS